jgi:hypothetical protein
VRIESVQGDQRQVWVLTARSHREAKRLLLPEGIRMSALRKEEYDPETGVRWALATTTTPRR